MEVAGASEIYSSEKEIKREREGKRERDRERYQPLIVHTRARRVYA